MIGVIRLSPNWVISIDEVDRAELRTLLPASSELLDGQLGRFWYACDPSLPVLNRSSVHSKLFSSFCLRITKRFPPLQKVPHVHSIVLLFRFLNRNCRM